MIESSQAARVAEPVAAPAAGAQVSRKPESILRRRLRRFRRLRRGYYSFLIITISYAASFLLPLFANNVALAVRS